MSFHVNCLPRQTIHMKCQALFSLKNEKVYFKVSSAAVVIGTLSLTPYDTGPKH